jgi:hypothetical protein
MHAQKSRRYLPVQELPVCQRQGGENMPICGAMRGKKEVTNYERD